MIKHAGGLLGGILIALFLCACRTTTESGDLTAVATSPTPAPTIVASPELSGEPARCQGRIAFAGRVNGERDILVVNADGSGLTNITNGDGADSSPAWSPDGERIAFERHAGNKDLYIATTDSRDLVRLTEMPSTEFAPTWSPDGKQIVFASQSSYATELYAIGAEAGEAWALTSSAAHKPELSWSPNGSLIAFTMYDGFNQGEIWLTAAPDFRGSGPENLTQHPAHDCCADWSPDGAWLLFLSSRTDGSPGSLLPHPAYLLAQAGQAASGSVRVVTTVMPEAVESLYLVRPDGTGLTRLSTGPDRVRDASWSPAAADGTMHIAFAADTGGHSDIAIIKVQEGLPGTITRLTGDSEDKRFPTWSPDGTCIAYQQRHGSGVDLYVVQTDGTGPTKLAENLVWGGGMSWAPDPPP